MTEAEGEDEQETSLFALGTALLRNRWRIARWMLVGAAIAAVAVFAKPALYIATASFVSQTNDTGQSGLSTLAGRFGVAVPVTGQSQSPEFYSKLLSSRVVLEPIVHDTLVVAEMGGKKVPFLDLFEIRGGSPVRRLEEGVKTLQGVVGVSVAKATGIVEVSVATKWPSVSLALAKAVVGGINEYNQRSRQSQAAVERRFVEERLGLANTELRQAEDRLQQFMMTNRRFTGSPELEFENQRLQREVTLRQQVYTSLMQSYEDVRIREVRDTPVITVVEPPAVRTTPEPRGRVKSVLLGLMLGGLIGVLLAFARLMVSRHRVEGNTEADEFFRNVAEVKAEVGGRFGRFRKPRVER